MKIKKEMERIIALLLVTATVGTGSGISTMADSIKVGKETGQATQQTQKDQTVSPDEIAKQIADGTYKGRKLKETKYYDTYEAADGSIIAAYYSSPIRYEDENGELQEYDSNLIKTDNKKASSYTGDAMSESYHRKDYAYVNTAGNSKQYFPEELSEESPILMEKEGYSLAFVPETDKEEAGEEPEENKVGNKSDAASGKAVKASEDRVEYTEDNVTYQYVSLDNGVKESVIINHQTDEMTYSFSYALDGMYMELDKKTNIIGLYDSKTKKEVAVIPAAYLNDSTGTNTSFDIKTKIKNSGDTWTVTYTLPESYMNDKDTVYPVTLDPTVEWVTYGNNENPLGISFVIELSPGSGDVCQYPNAVNRFVIRSGAGDYYKTYMQFNKMNKLLRGKQVNYAFGFISVADQVGGEMTVDMHEITEDWELESLKWENEPAVDSEVLSQALIEEQIGRSYQINFTKYCTMVAEEEADAMQGVELRTEEKSKYMEFWGVKSQSGAPIFLVSYNSPEEIDARYDGSFQIDAEYNDETEKIDVSWEDSTQTATLYRVYKRTGNSFEYVGKTTGKSYEVETDDIETIADIRVMAVDQKGTQLDTTDDVNVLSNIVTFAKQTDISADEDSGETSTVAYEQTTVDTDGDGLEDGYEIWDFKTLWNTETGEDEEGNKTYDLDTDKDGFPDSYEVFTLGTDPAVANRYDEDGNETDSDSDGWTDFKEYQEGTDPWLKDSDFDGTNDRGDATPRKTNDYTRQTRAAEAAVHKGLYDREYSENIDGVIYTYIINIYRGDMKQISVDYGNASLNKVMKYFYDETGNNTAVIEAYDETYDPNHTQTICITYTYDADGNVTFICDQRTKYTMNYGTDGQMTQLKVGNQTLMTYGDVELVNNADSNGDTTNIQTGGIINKNEHTETYGNGQSVKTVTTTYKVADNDTTSTAIKTETYYNSDPKYVTYLNADGEIIKLQDYSTDSSNPVEWNYSYAENGTSVTRSDGFTKSIQTSENEDSGVSIIVTSYGFKDLNNSSRTYTSTITSQTETETDAEGLEQEKNVVSQTLHNGDTVNIESADDVSEEKIHSNAYHTNVIKSTYEKEGNTGATYNVDIYAGAADKEFDYTYDLTGNITKIKLNGDVRYEYAYDAHGRLTTEKDYTILKEYSYDYNTNGNVYGKTEYPINADGNRTDSDGTTIHYTYENSEWPDQLTTYNGQTITYDNSGNPLTYVGGLEFTWSRGRQLSTVTLGDESSVSYRYNENGLRTYKDTSDTTTVYEWDGSTLLRETVTYKSTNQKADVWYLYDANGSVIGFEYSYLNFAGTLVTARVYYEKNLQGDVIGLLDARGAEIAAYTYDAWGNVTSSTYVEGNEIPYELNHITYRGYYRDEETGFYYLQSRYYDAETSRFLNADDTSLEELKNGNIFYSNIYIYCASNPCTYIDKDGNLIVVNPKIPLKVLKHSVWLAASSFLTFKGYNLSKAMFKHALYGNGKELSYKTKGIAIKKMKKSFAFTKYISNCLNLLQKKGYTNVYFVKNSYEFSSDRDLYYSLQHVKVVVHAIKLKGNNWKTEINVSDVYDFTEVRSWSSFAGIANNIDYYLQKCRELKPYKVKIKYNDVNSSKFNII